MTAILVFVGIAYGLFIALSLVVAVTCGYQSPLAGIQQSAATRFAPPRTVTIVAAA